MEDSNFRAVEELIDNIQRGGEVEFEYDNKKYSITHTSNGISVMQFYNYDTEEIYEMPEEVIEYKIEGEKLGYIIKELKVTFRCFHS